MSASEMLISQRYECICHLTGLYALVFCRNNQVKHNIEENADFFTESELLSVAEQKGGLSRYKTIKM